MWSLYLEYGQTKNSVSYVEYKSKYETTYTQGYILNMRYKNIKFYCCNKTSHKALFIDQVYTLFAKLMIYRPGP